MKTKAELINALPSLEERLAKFGVDIEDVEKIEFKDGHEIIYGSDWILSGDCLLKKPDIADPETREHIRKEMKKLSPIAKKRLGKE